MKRLSIKDLVKFRSKSEKAKQNFANNIKVEKQSVPVEGGADYWIRSLSAISNGYRLNKSKPIIDKKDELEVKLETTENTKTKNMYKRNIKILGNYENFDFATLRPVSDLNFLKKKKDNYTLVIKEIPIQVKPSYIFSFDNNGIQQVGAVWFIAKLDGFKIEDLGMFSDILYEYLITHFSKEYNINTSYCIAIDVFNSTEVNYSQLESKEVLPILNSTLDSLKALM